MDYAAAAALGLFLEERHDVDVPAMLADPIDPQTGEYLAIDQGFDPTDAHLLHVLTVNRGSGSAVHDVGQKFRDQELIDGGLETFFREEVRFAVRDLTERGDVEQLSTSAAPNAADRTQADVEVGYFNAAQQQRRALPIPTARRLPR
jgi:hypothetical protein